MQSNFLVYLKYLTQPRHPSFVYLKIHKVLKKKNREIILQPPKKFPSPVPLLSFSRHIPFSLKRIIIKAALSTNFRSPPHAITPFLFKFVLAYLHICVIQVVRVRQDLQLLYFHIHQTFYVCGYVNPRIPVGDPSLLPNKSSARRFWNGV